MVKITNVLGDIKTGNSGDFIFQKVHGKQVMRKGYKEKKPPSPKQIEQRTRFKESIAWVQGLTGKQKSELKQLYKHAFPQYTKGTPSTWFNYGKWLYLSHPIFTIINPNTYEYRIEHPAILSVSELDSNNNLLFSDTNLSSLSECSTTSSYTHIPVFNCSKLLVETLPGINFTSPFTIPPRYFSPISIPSTPNYVLNQNPVTPNIGCNIQSPTPFPLSMQFPIPTYSCIPVPAWTIITDDFADGVLNSNIWSNIHGWDSRCYVSEGGGTLNVQTYGAYGRWTGNYFDPSIAYTSAPNDFVGRFKVTNVWNDNGYDTNSGILIYNSRGQAYLFNMHGDGTLYAQYTNTTSTPSWNIIGTPVTIPSRPFYLQISRTGNTLSFQYGPDYNNLNTYITVTQEVNCVNFGCYAFDYTATAGASFDEFYLATK